MNRNLIPWRKNRDVPARSWDSGGPFEALHRQMNEVFEDFLQGSGAALRPSVWQGERGIDLLSPKFEVAETESEVQVTAELPGMDEKDVEVTLEDNMLTVKGEKKDLREEKKKNYFISECSYGQFRRSVPLPAGVDEAKVKAKFAKGVLKVTLPKTGQEKKTGKQIEVTAE